MLIRARKYGLVEFEGEMLYQGQDNNKIVRLLKSMEEIQQIVQFSGDPVQCISIKSTLPSPNIKNSQTPAVDTEK